MSQGLPNPGGACALSTRVGRSIRDDQMVIRMSRLLLGCYCLGRHESGESTVLEFFR